MHITEHLGIALRNRSGKRHDWYIVFNGRVRWGTLDEVKADAEHIQTFGYLPRCEKGWA